MADRPMVRRSFFEKLGAGALGVAAAGNLVQDASAAEWQPVSERKVRVGIVGYGSCRFGAAFGFQKTVVFSVCVTRDDFLGLSAACRRAHG